MRERWSAQETLQVILCREYLGKRSLKEWERLVSGIEPPPVAMRVACIVIWNMLGKQSPVDVDRHCPKIKDLVLQGAMLEEHPPAQNVARALMLIGFCETLANRYTSGGPDECEEG